MTWHPLEPGHEQPQYWLALFGMIQVLEGNVELIEAEWCIYRQVSNIRRTLVDN